MASVRTDGAEIYYERTGSGIPVVLVTGLTGDTGFWNKAVPLLSDQCDVVTMDNRGSGRTVIDREFTIQDMADDVASLVTQLDMGPVHMLGWSMGSHIALDFAARYPGLTRSLTLVSSYVRRPSRSAYILNAMAEGLVDGSMSEETAGMFMNVLLRNEGFFRSAEDSGRPIRVPHLCSRTGMHQQMKAVEGYSPRHDAVSLRVPVLSVHGTEDIMVPPGCGDELADLITGCRRLRVPDEGHVMRPESYMPEFLEFVKGV